MNASLLYFRLDCWKVPCGLALGLAALAVACGHGAGGPSQDAGASPDPGQRIAALGTADEIAIYTGDVDGDGLPDLVLSARRAGAGARAAPLPSTPSMAGVALVHSANGSLIVAIDNTTLDLAQTEFRVSLRVADLQDQVSALVAGLSSEVAGASSATATGDCQAVVRTADLIASAVKHGLIDNPQLIKLLQALLGLLDPALSNFDDTNFLGCLQTPQTPLGCLAIAVLFELFPDVRPHCYQVTDGNVSTMCGTPAPLAMCQKAQDPSGCCNPAFIYKIMLTNIGNLVPFPIDPAEGPISAQPTTVILGTPFLGELSAFLRLVPGLDHLRCLLTGLLATRNPVEMTIDGTRCGTNTALPGHFLQGDVTECIHNSTSEVYATIVGQGNGRFATLNELLGPIVLGTVRLHFGAEVGVVLSLVNALGLTCSGGELVGGDLTVGPGGMVTVTPTDGLPVYGYAWGDPHLRTQDGTLYNFQYVGEFVLLRGPNGVVVQVRQAPYGASRRVAVIVALAAQVGDNRIQIDAGTPPARILVNGAAGGPMTFADGSSVDLNGITWSDGTRLDVRNRVRYLSVFLHASPGHAFTGLLGDHDGKTADDFQLRDGTVLARPLSAADAQAYARAWRITMDESLFTYDTGQGTVTFTDPTFPDGNAVTSDLAADVYAAARATCVARGITDPATLDTCILDVGTTGDTSFADDGAGVAPPVSSNPAIYDVAVDPQSMTVDRLSPFALAPDGIKDGVFTATVAGPIAGFSLVSANLQGQPAGGQFWDTVAGNATWTLGVEEDGVLLNRPDGSIPLLAAGTHRLRFFADNSGFFVHGQPFRLSALLADGTTAAAPLLIYAVPAAACTGASAHWLFDEGTQTIAADRSGHDHALQLFGTQAVAGHDSPGAIALDGVASYGQVAHDPILDIAHALTVTAWIKPDAVPASGGLVGTADLGGAQDWALALSGSELAALGPGIAPILSSGAGLQAGVWAFVALVIDVDAGKLSFYRDRRLVSTAAFQPPLPSHALPITVGSDAAGQRFRGQLDDVALWPRALSAADLATVFAGGCPP